MIARDSDQALSYRPQSLVTGRSIFGLRTDFIQSSKRINSEGKKENLGLMFEEKGVDSDGNFTNRYEFEASYFQLTPYWGYGLTSKWSIYFGLPVYQVQTKTKRTERMSSASAALVNNNNKPNLKPNSKTPDSPENDSNQMFIGQAVLSTQYLMVDGINHKLGLTQKLRFPSAGRDDSIYFTHGTPEALGYGLGAGINYEFIMTRGFSFISSVDGIMNLNDEVFVRPEGNDLAETDRNPGDTVAVRAMFEKSVFDSSYLQLGVSLEQKSEDEIDLTPKDSSAFEEAEAQRLLVAYEYRPESARRNSTENLVSGRVSYSHLLSGVNVTAENSAAVEIQIAY